MISAKAVVVVLCVSLGVSRGDILEKVDRVLQNLAIQRSQPSSKLSAVAFDEDEFFNHAGQFKQFVIEYNRDYDSDVEIEKRFDIFRENLKEIDFIQKNELGTATYGVNQFADLTAKEFSMGLSPVNLDDIERASGFEIYNPKLGKELAPKINYKEQGKVLAKVQDQLLCGSCWAHAAVATIETANAIKNNKLVELSKQQLVDCDFLDAGCCGGWPFYAYEYIKHVGGLMEEKDYKQRYYEGPCQFDQKKANVTLDKYYMIYTRSDPVFNEFQFEKFLNDVGALVTVINANGFRFYRGGVMNQPSLLCNRNPNHLNHAVFNIGYDVETVNGERFQYWIIKNSWGEKWGENGYIRILKGSNVCGLGWLATGVVVK